jgi:hypothetical protein
MDQRRYQCGEPKPPWTAPRLRAGQGVDTSRPDHNCTPGPDESAKSGSATSAPVRCSSKNERSAFCWAAWTSIRLNTVTVATALLSQPWGWPKRHAMRRVRPWVPGLARLSRVGPPPRPPTRRQRARFRIRGSSSASDYHRKLGHSRSAIGSVAGIHPAPRTGLP